MPFFLIKDVSTENDKRMRYNATITRRNGLTETLNLNDDDRLLFCGSHPCHFLTKHYLKL